MYDFNNSTLQVSEEDILSKISEVDIFKYYIKTFVEVGVAFCSDIRNDKNPSCSVYINSLNNARYKDFSTGENFNCWGYIMNKYSCTYYEALNIVATDFKLSTIKSTITPRVLLSNDNVLLDDKRNNVKIKSEIHIISQPFTIIDHDYWARFGITLDLLNEFNVYSCRYVYLIRGNKRTIYEYKKTNPIYGYRFSREGQYYYKIYLPRGEKGYKWLFNGSTNDIEGFDQLPLTGELLIISKSLKDVMCLRVLGYNAISLQGEANKLSSELLNKLYKRFDNIIVFYDNDEQGIKSAKALNQTYGLPMIMIPQNLGFKDISDYIKGNTLEKGKTLLKELISM